MIRSVCLISFCCWIWRFWWHIWRL